MTISAGGAWTLQVGGGQVCTPDGRGEPGRRWGYLAARVGDGDEFFAGSDCTFTAEADGMLQLRINERPDQLHDNEGHATVIVQIRPAAE